MVVAENVEEIIRKQLDKTIRETDFALLGNLYKGKVRDNYISDDKKIRIIIATAL